MNNTYLLQVKVLGISILIKVFKYMKNLKWLWLVSVSGGGAYFVNEWLKSGFDPVGFATMIASNFSGIPLFYKKINPFD